MRTPRSLTRTLVLAGLTGALSVSVAWAGVGLAPVGLPGTAAPTSPAASSAPQGAGAAALAPAAVQRAADAAQQAADAPAEPLPPLPEGQVWVGAARTSLEPDPEAAQADFPGARWERDRAECVVLDEAYLARLLGDAQTEVDHLVTAGSPWPENPDCLYMGGYGLGPVNPITSFDAELGLWVRALAIGDGEDLAVITVVDAEGWLWDYASKCTDCGTKQIADALAAEPALAARGLRPESFNLHATHSHTAMDFLGGWGFVPDWYMAQATERVKQTVRDAVAGMRPAVLEVGGVSARAHNSERRDTYRSAEEDELTWLRAVSADRGGRDVIATLGAFAAHPVTQRTAGGVAHPDWPGDFAKAAEDRFGGVGLHVMTGLGNVTGARATTGQALVGLIPDLGQGRLVDAPDVRVARRTWRQPVTNVPLDALGTPGFFDRQFDAVPATLRTGKDPELAPCVSAAPQSVELPVGAVRIGDDVVMTTGPGELFSNSTNTIKEKSPGQVVFPFAQTNDSLGYMPQSFEIDPVGQQGLGFVAGGYVFVNYEDSYAVDRCVGDMALETALALVRDLE